ncbi:MAG: hypothetical protein KIT27_02490 [Legionellales bacterium]|nr:hypothetical protein [Legionellales bacterium]
MTNTLSKNNTTATNIDTTLDAIQAEFENFNTELNRLTEEYYKNPKIILDPAWIEAGNKLQEWNIRLEDLDQTIPALSTDPSQRENLQQSVELMKSRLMPFQFIHSSSNAAWESRHKLDRMILSPIINTQFKNKEIVYQHYLAQQDALKQFLFNTISHLIVTNHQENRLTSDNLAQVVKENSAIMNGIYYTAQSDILYRETREEAAIAYCRWLHLCRDFEVAGNYEAAFFIYNALYSPQVERWGLLSALPNHEQQLFENFKQLFNSSHNYKQLRNIVEERQQYDQNVIFPFNLNAGRHTSKDEQRKQFKGDLNTAKTELAELNKKPLKNENDLSAIKKLEERIEKLTSNIEKAEKGVREFLDSINQQNAALSKVEMPNSAGLQLQQNIRSLADKKEGLDKIYHERSCVLVPFKSTPLPLNLNLDKHPKLFANNNMKKFEQNALIYKAWAMLKQYRIQVGAVVTGFVLAKVALPVLIALGAKALAAKLIAWVTGTSIAGAGLFTSHEKSQSHHARSPASIMQGLGVNDPSSIRTNFPELEDKQPDELGNSTDHPLIREQKIVATSPQSGNEIELNNTPSRRKTI